MSAKQIKLIDCQHFISKEARNRYFDKMKNSYDYVVFTNNDYQYNIYFYDEEKPSPPEDHLDKVFWEK